MAKRKGISFKMICKANHKEFEKEVTRFLEHNWKLHGDGGLAIDADENGDSYFYQGMVLEQ